MFWPASLPPPSPLLPSFLSIAHVHTPGSAPPSRDGEYPTAHSNGTSRWSPIGLDLGTSLGDGCELLVVCLSMGAVARLRLLWSVNTRKRVNAGNMTFTGNKGNGGNLFLQFLLTSAFISTCHTTYAQHTAVQQISLRLLHLNTKGQSPLANKIVSLGS